MDLLIPKPASLKRREGNYSILPVMTVAIAPDTPQVRSVAAELAALLQSAAGSEVSIQGDADGGQITLGCCREGQMSIHSWVARGTTCVLRPTAS